MFPWLLGITEDRQWRWWCSSQDMAYNTNLHTTLPYSSATLGWDELYNFGGVFNADDMETIEPFFSPCVDSDMSTGYLEDALIEWNNPSKRRRVSSDGNYPSSSSENTLENFNCLSEILNTCRLPGVITDEGQHSSLSSDGRDIKPPEEVISASETDNSSSSCSMDLLKGADSLVPKEEPFAVGDHRRSRRKKLLNGVVYPFAVVKPGGFEGDVTLKDINERIHMPPTRPVKHPVGDFACRPCISPDGPGISGKFVVSFTRIQTQGRGTITIVRTRG